MGWIDKAGNVMVFSAITENPGVQAAIIELIDKRLEELKIKKGDEEDGKQ